MKTDYGKACYRLHSAGYRREAGASGLGPVANEVLERKERLIEKSGGRLSEGQPGFPWKPIGLRVGGFLRSLVAG